jgi:hypothetical protein
MTESEYWKEVQLFSVEVEDAVVIYHTYEEINRLAIESEEIRLALNRDALFWNVQVYSLQTCLFIILGRIFDTGADVRSVHRIVTATLRHLEFFSKHALTQRKAALGLSPRDLADFMSSAWAPDRAIDLEHLRNALSTHTKLYKGAYLPIRNKVFAHRLTERDGAGRLFQAISSTEIGSILDFLHDLTDAIWNLYQNGIKPELGSRCFDEHNEKIRDGARNVLRRIIGPKPVGLDAGV